ncbi:MAG: DUF1844 domain-containing protein [Bdellovibrionota bacterium]
MSEEEQGTKGFKVNDKRRFDDAGNQKSEAQQAETGSSATPKAAKTSIKEESKDFKLSDSNKTQAYELNFSSFIVSLATQALMQLGEMPTPEGINIPKDKEAAKQTIDIIAILKDKTKGNLDENETRLIDEIIHNLRMAFVKA